VTLLLPFQQSIASTFYEQLLRQYYFAEKLQSQTVFREKLCKVHMYKKLPIKCWWNWHLGSISPKCLCAAFTQADPESTKWVMSLFALLGSTSVKAWCKMLVKSSPESHVIFEWPFIARILRLFGILRKKSKKKVLSPYFAGF